MKGKQSVFLTIRIDIVVNKSPFVALCHNQALFRVHERTTPNSQNIFLTWPELHKGDLDAI